VARERDAVVAGVRERLGALGALTARPMFGGVGLSCDGTFFALIRGEAVYFMVDAESVEDYRAAGARPFRERPAGEVGYHEVPAAVQADGRRFLAWARKAVAAGKRRDAKKKA